MLHIIPIEEKTGGTDMNILFYDTKRYDMESFDAIKDQYDKLTIDYVDTDLSVKTARLAKGYDAICAFVSSDVSAPVVNALSDAGVKLILMRCAGFNNVDMDAAKKCGITVMRVPGYSPEAVAEHAMALAMAVNRRLHKSYIKVRENNFSLVGLTGMNFYGKTAGIVGTGKIGAAMARICFCFGLVLFFFFLAGSDLISLHCPLTDETYHMINEETIGMMKDHVILVNTSRGALIKTDDLIAGIRSRKFFGIGLDVYEEETPNVFENREDDILESSITARLLSFPNVIVTSHQGFLTEEALEAISRTTLDNAMDFLNGSVNESNIVL